MSKWEFSNRVEHVDRVDFKRKSMETSLTRGSSGQVLFIAGLHTATVTSWPAATSPLHTSAQNTLVPAAFDNPVMTCMMRIVETIVHQR